MLQRFLLLAAALLALTAEAGRFSATAPSAGLRPSPITALPRIPTSIRVLNLTTHSHTAELCADPPLPWPMPWIWVRWGAKTPAYFMDPIALANRCARLRFRPQEWEPNGLTIAAAAKGRAVFGNAASPVQEKWTYLDASNAHRIELIGAPLKKPAQPGLWPGSYVSSSTESIPNAVVKTVWTQPNYPYVLRQAILKGDGLITANTLRQLPVAQRELEMQSQMEHTVRITACTSAAAHGARPLVWSTNHPRVRVVRVQEDVTGNATTVCRTSRVGVAFSILDDLIARTPLEYGAPGVEPWYWATGNGLSYTVTGTIPGANVATLSAKVQVSRRIPLLLSSNIMPYLNDAKRQSEQCLANRLLNLVSTTAPAMSMARLLDAPVNGHTLKVQHFSRDEVLAEGPCSVLYFSLSLSTLWPQDMVLHPGALRVRIWLDDQLVLQQNLTDVLTTNATGLGGVRVAADSWQLLINKPYMGLDSLADLLNAMSVGQNFLVVSPVSVGTSAMVMVAVDVAPAFRRLYGIYKSVWTEETGVIVASTPLAIGAVMGTAENDRCSGIWTDGLQFTNDYCNTRSVWFQRLPPVLVAEYGIVDRTIIS